MGFKVLFGTIEEHRDDKGAVVSRSSEIEVDLDDLAPEVYQFPAQNPERMHRVLCAAAAHAGIAPPDRAASMRAANEQNDRFERVEDIAEEPMENGFPPKPDAMDAGSSSGAPDDSAGPPTSSGDSALRSMISVMSCSVARRIIRRGRSFTGGA